MKPTTIHEQAYEFYQWNELGEDILDLAAQILKADTPKFDRVIALAKGGLTFARSMVDFLQINDVSSIKIEFYTGIGQTTNTPVITQSLPVSIKGENILIFDDIVDKGDTMRMAKDYIEYHGAKSITTAALIKKPWSSFDVDFAARSSEAWVIFPNEVRETINTLTTMWQKKGDSPDIIEDQLLKIGFSKKEVALLASLE